MRRGACWETASTEVERELKSMRIGLFAWPAPNWWVVQPGVFSGWDPEGPTWNVQLLLTSCVGRRCMNS